MTTTTAWLSDEERLDWLQLVRSDAIGPAAFRTLIETFGTAADAIAALPDLANRGGAKNRVTIADRAAAEAELATAERFGIAFIGLFEPAYPDLLRQTESAPPLLAVSGSTDSLAQTAVAIVGSRNASAAGRKMAGRLARDLGEAGLVIVSGLARGVDTSAHQGALNTGTVAVFAGGLDRVYPPEIVAAGGAAVSEMPLGWQARGKDFPRRNRIISGLAYATIVVEAAVRSGSLITARRALEQNREVMAVPGSPLDPRAAGTNQLIKEGAALVDSAEDVLEILKPIVGDGFSAPRQSVPLTVSRSLNAADGVALRDRDRELVLQALSPSPIEIDEIVRMTGLPSRTVSVSLLELELAGGLERHPGQRVSLR